MVTESAPASVADVTAEERTATRTIRVDREVDQLLDELAGREGISVNALVNRALRKFVQWDVHAEKFGFMMVSASAVRALLESIPDETLRRLASSEASNLAREYTQYWFGRVSVDNVVAMLELLGERYAGLFRFEHTAGESGHTLMLSHDLGAKWSAVLEESLKVIFKDLLVRPVEVEATQRLVVARF